MNRMNKPQEEAADGHARNPDHETLERMMDPQLA